MQSLDHSIVSYLERYKQVIALTVAAALILAIFVPYQNRATIAAPLADPSYKPPNHDGGKPSSPTVKKYITHITNIVNNHVAIAIAIAIAGGSASAAAGSCC